MSDFLKKIKSVFVVEDENATASAAAKPNATATPIPTPPQNQTASVASAPIASTASGGSLNDKFMDILFGAIEKSNQEGFDYFEFKQSLKNLAKMPLDEATRFQSAYAMAQTMGATPVKLVDSAQFYLNVLNNEQAKFNEAHAQQRGRLIGNREDEVKNHEAMIQQKAEQIKQLTQQIEEHRRSSEQIRKEINESTVKIESTKADFEVTFAAVVGQITDDINKIKNYLK